MIKESNVIHLGIYGDTAFSILRIIKLMHHVTGDFNSYTTCSDRNMFNDISIERAADNEIILAYKHSTLDVNKTQVWLASVVKGFAKISTKAKYWQRNNIHKESISKCEYWNRKNDDYLTLFNPGVRMSDMYALYEVLKGRKVNWSKFTASDIKDRIAGQPFDPVRTECELSYREQLAEINASFNAAKEVENIRYCNECNAIYAKHQEKFKALQHVRLNAIAKLNSEYAGIRNANAGLSEQQAVRAV